MPHTLLGHIAVFFTTAAFAVTRERLVVGTHLFWGLSLSLTEVLLIMVIFGAASALQSVIGFGSVIISGPFLVLIEPRFVPGPALLAGIALTLLILLRDGSQADFGIVVKLNAARLIGSAVGAFILARLSADATAAVMALFMLAGAGAGMIGISIRPTKISLVITGIAAGIFGTVAGLAGAVTALLVQDEKGIKLRGSMAAYLLPGAVISAVTVAVMGRMTIIELKLFVILIPSILIGHGISTRFRRVLDRFAAKPLVLTMSSIAAATVLIKYAVKLLK